MSDHAQAHGNGEHKHHGLTLVGYLGIFVVLIGLTILTYVMAHIDLGSANLPIALAIAVAKGTLVCLFFMHLWGDTRVNQFIMILSLLFVMLMMGMTIADVNTRFPLTAPPGSERFKVNPHGQLE